VNNQELERRRERAQTETWIIAKTDDGFRVYSPLAPANQWLVSQSDAGITCTCPDYQHHANDPEWQCKHMIAVQNHLNGTNQGSGGDAAPAAEPSSNPAPPKEPKKSGGHSTEATMLIKRSLSPDGRIDSLSVEFSLPVGKITSDEIKQQAERALKLQGEIMQGFVKNSPVAASRNGSVPGATAAQLLNIAAMDTRRGRSLFINVLVNNQVAKFFGGHKELAEALIGAGYPDKAAEIGEDVTLNLPCQAVTKRNGKYLNIERLLPAPAQNGG